MIKPIGISQKSRSVTEPAREAAIQVPKPVFGEGSLRETVPQAAAAAAAEIIHIERIEVRFSAGVCRARYQCRRGVVVDLSPRLFEDESSSVTESTVKMAWWAIVNEASVFELTVT